MINRSYPRYRGYLVGGDIHAPGIEPGTWTNPRTSFSSRWFRIDWDTCHVTLTGHVSLPIPRPPYLMMPYYCMALPMILFFVGRVGGKFKDSCGASWHPILDSPINLAAKWQDGLKTASLFLFCKLIVPGNPRAFLETVQDLGYYNYGSTVLITT